MTKYERDKFLRELDNAQSRRCETCSSVSDTIVADGNNRREACA
jgi:hypothetical protein